MYNKHNNTIFNYYNTKDNVHGAVIMTKSLQAFIHFSSRLQNSAKWVIHTITQLCIRGFTTMRCIHRLFTYLLTYLLTTDIRPSQPTRAVSPPVGCYLLQKTSFS